MELAMMFEKKEQLVEVIAFLNRILDSKELHGDFAHCVVVIKSGKDNTLKKNAYHVSREDFERFNKPRPAPRKKRKKPLQPPLEGLPSYVSIE